MGWVIAPRGIEVENESLNISRWFRQHIVQSKIVESTIFGRPTVVHNLFRPRATYRFLKPFGGQTSATAPGLWRPILKNLGFLGFF